MLLYLSGHGKQHESQQDKAFQEIIKKDLTKQNKCSNINNRDASEPRQLNQCYAWTGKLAIKRVIAREQTPQAKARINSWLRKKRA